MNTSEFTYRIYKTFVKAVPLGHPGAGFHFLKQSIPRNFNFKYKIMKHYRYQSHITYREDLPAHVNIRFIEFESVKETKSGYWIIEKCLLNSYKIKPSINPIFVLKQSKKRFAYPTKEEAFNSFVIRNRRRITFLKRDLEHAEILKQSILKFR